MAILRKKTGEKSKRPAGLLLLLLFAIFPFKSLAQYNIDRLMTSGEIALHYEDYVLSIQYFNQIISQKPYIFQPWQYRAIAKYYLDDFVGAEADATEALRLNPYVEGMYDLRAIARIRQQNYQGAIDDYNKAIRLNPRSQNYRFNRALCMMNVKDFDHALLETDTMMMRWSRMANAYTLRAEIYLLQADTTEAVVWLDKSLEIDPYTADTWTTRAIVSLARKEWRKADEYLGKAIHLKPKTAVNYINRALARLNFNNLRGAMSDYDTAIDLDPHNFLAHYNRGLLRMQIGDDNRAIEDFDYVITMEPDNVMAIFNRGVLHEQTGNLRAAIADYTTVIDQFPNFWTGLTARARCYERLGMHNEAELDNFKVLKAQMDKHLGIQQRWSEEKVKQVRKRSEIDLDKYDQLVVDDENKVEHEYQSAYRGKIQNRSVEVTIMPMYQLSYFPYQNGLQSYQAFDHDVESFNMLTETGEDGRLFVNCHVTQLSEEQSNDFFQTINELTVRIDTAGTQRLSHLLLLRSVAYSVMQDYNDAITDLSAILDIDNNSCLAYWQRAVCQSMLNQFNKAHGIESKLNAGKVQLDLTHAIEINPQNPYLYYNRGNHYFQTSDYNRAIDDYTKAIELDSRLAEAYYNRGLSHIQAGHKLEGIADLSKAGELGIYDAYSIIKKNSK
ncbi:MAG: tetratricopeptide repeat protein [Prevotella sp.]|nr:tetratricopeptide repeat protein [Prevotella sp.]